ncbi:hypothetical protein ACFX15_023631 [Malus domestica]
MDTKIISLREYGVIYSHLPESYVRPEFDRPRLSKDSECKNIPVVELASPNRAQTVQQIGDACKNKGFFLRHHQFAAQFGLCWEKPGVDALKVIDSPLSCRLPSCSQSLCDA